MALKFKFKTKDEIPAEHLPLYSQRDRARILSRPTQIGLGTIWRDVAAGSTHTVALQEGGTLWTLEANEPDNSATETPSHR